ncbi:MAG TPA: hypothetical protein VKR32_10270 [Puia sp.]|nr:hypothetical protein [Puia sp.]
MLERNKYEFLIGIDCGVNTGMAAWERSSKRFAFINTMMIHEALLSVKILASSDYQGKIFIRVEDARKRKWFGDSGREQLQGAGSVKRDAKIWEDFLTDLKIPFEMVEPKNNKTKLTAPLFAKMTGYQERTSEHGRDAAMLVYGF